ncbi:MAG: histidine kinase dimerization/phospho-acceptor domain-containing protein [Planctomycetota bacterium]
MSATAAGPPQATPPAVAETKLNASDLAELMATFSAASDQLQATHVRLQSEVERLRGELLETKGQLRRAQQLAALGEMAAGIAHEIRNPLGSIKLYCSALIDDLGPMPQQQGMARKVAGAVDRLNAVVGDVLAFSREMKVSKIATSTHELLDLAVECCEGDAAMFEVQFDCAYRRRTDTPAWCDATLMRQALVNVIRNACEAASESSGQRR